MEKTLFSWKENTGCHQAGFYKIITRHEVWDVRLTYTRTYIYTHTHTHTHKKVTQGGVGKG